MKPLLLVALAAADFFNAARQAGFTHVVPNGGVSTKKWLVETTGSGVAWVDYDNDGLLDAVVVSGPGAPSRLYRNAGGGKFVAAALGPRDGWGQGVCAGDYDNDGFTDLVVTYWGQNALYRNMGGKRFEDVAAKAGLKQDRVRWNTGCAFLDYDNDGDLDLFVANYLQFDFGTTPKPGDNPYCFYRGLPVNCGPRGFTGLGEHGDDCEVRLALGESVPGFLVLSSPGCYSSWVATKNQGPDGTPLASGHD